MRKTLDTRTRIIQAGKKLFSERGFDATTIRDIATEADVALSALNYHFTNKENLFFELANEFIAEQTRHRFQVLSEPSSPEDFRSKLELYADLHIASLCIDLPLYRFMSREFLNPRPGLEVLLRGPVKQYILDVNHFVRSASRRGFLRAGFDQKFFVKIFVSNLGDNLRADRKGKRPKLADAEYRKKWVKSFIGVLLDGCLSENAR